ncbi:uncharacterized protein LOC133735881 isoform X4 [Rosa rugosa]|uniref:uncharacterized protein LOC133735881 isoform X4 n=1 Tax=Rosa rugosa TaxID=74645 RepID=UPI002B404497|nr:uncharacterized protein LOC133735881 isoform X4 [Rosa rugosa]
MFLEVSSFFYSQRINQKKKFTWVGFCLLVTYQSGANCLISRLCILKGERFEVETEKKRYFCPHPCPEENLDSFAIKTFSSSNSEFRENFTNLIFSKHCKCSSLQGMLNGIHQSDYPEDQICLSGVQERIHYVFHNLRLTDLNQSPSRLGRKEEICRSHSKTKVGLARSFLRMDCL